MVGLVVVAAVVLSTTAWAGGSLSIGVRLPFGQRSRRDRSYSGRRQRPQEYRPFRRGSYYSQPYRRDSRIRRYGYERPELRFGYTFSWGDEREVRRDGRQARESVRNLIWTLRYGRSSERERAARDLGRLQVDDVVEALIDSLLRDPEKDVRKEAARSLGNLGAEEARPALRQAARHDPSKRVREAAEDALKKLRPERRPRPYWPEYRRYDRDEAKLDKLLRELASPHKSERKDAAKDLGKLKDRRAVPALIQALKHDPEEDVREEAAEALGRIGDRSALPALRWAVRHDHEKDVRRKAEKAIDKITD